MKDQPLSYQELLDENSLLTRRIQELEHSETTRKQAEDALRASEEMILNSQSLAHICSYSTTLNDNNLEESSWVCSPEFYQIFGIDKTYPHTIAGWAGFIHPDHREELVAYHESVIKNKTSFSHEYKIIRINDGAERWVQGTGELVCDELGKPVRMHGAIQDITDRKRAENTLKESEARLRSVLDATPFPVAIVDLQDDKVEFWSQSALAKFGHTAPTAAEWYKIAYPDPEYRQYLVNRWKPCLEKAKSSGQPVNVGEHRVTCHDGSVRICEIYAAFVTKNLVITFNDITERKQAEETLQRTKQLLAESEQIGKVGGWEFNIDTLEQNWTDETFRIHEVDLNFDQTVEKGINFYTPDSKLIIENAVRRAIELKEPFDLDLKIVTAKGNLRHVHTIGKVDLANRRIFGFFQDITERKVVEETIAAEKERLAVTLRSIGDGVITTDTQGNVVIMNKVAEKLCGWNLAEAHGKPITTVFNIINESTRKPHENPVEKVLESGEIIELANHTLLISRDGTERVIADSGAPIKDQNSVTIGVVLVFRDMTEKQKLLDALQRTDKLDSLGALAGGIAHDFNNMLAGIFGYIDLARESTTDTTVTDYLDKSMSVFSRAKDLTQQLLTFSKGGAPQRKTSELGPLIRECASFALSGSKVACDYAIDKDLWLADFDKNQIGQVIDNLVINAQQSMPMGGRIVISAKNAVMKEGENLFLKAGMFIKLSITDTGIGIPADLLKRIFDPFFTTKQKGHGLGLATCYAIVQKHEGYIDVESVMGKGSTFHVFLPASQLGAVQADSPKAVSHKGNGRILIMDDEPSIREIFGHFLKSMGYTVLEAKDGEEALRICAEAASKGTPIDGAFFDLTIPGGMGGKETIIQLRKQFPNMPVYASSGYSEDPVIARPTEYGFTDSIRKPYRKDELATMLNRHAPKDSSGGNSP